LSSVLLPDPFGPMMQTISPFPTVAEIPSMTRLAP
jgi:hypothetical protein